MTEKKLNDFGLTKEEAEKSKDYKPSFDLGKMEVGDKVYFTLMEDMPRLIKFIDKKTKKEKETYAIEAIDSLTKMTVTLWLSAKSLRMSMFNLYKKNNTLKDLNVCILVRKYDHAEFGETRAYTVQESELPE